MSVYLPAPLSGGDSSGVLLLLPQHERGGEDEAAQDELHQQGGGHRHRGRQGGPSSTVVVCLAFADRNANERCIRQCNVWQVRRSQPDKPIHSPRDSLISATSEFQNYEGIVNWAFLLLAIGGLRLGLENVNKYGVLRNIWGNKIYCHTLPAKTHALCFALILACRLGAR